MKEKLLNSNMEVYIIWDEVNLPIIKTDLFSVIDVIYDVTEVSFDTWLLSIDIKEVVEFYNESEITWSIIEN
ncbi:CDI toxin immunity protein [Clostridium sardiniense]